MPWRFGNDLSWRIPLLASSPMPSPLPRTERAIADFQNLLSQYPHTDEAIQSYLTSHINVLMCAEIEREVSRLFQEKLERDCHDAATLSYIMRYIQRGAVANATVQEIKEKLSFFGREYGERFDDAIRQSVGNDGIGKMSVAVKNRNATAHDVPPVIDFQEVKETYQAATAIVAAVHQTLLP